MSFRRLSEYFLEPQQTARARCGCSLTACQRGDRDQACNCLIWYCLRHTNYLNEQDPTSEAPLHALTNGVSPFADGLHNMGSIGSPAIRDFNNFPVTSETGGDGLHPQDNDPRTGERVEAEGTRASPSATNLMAARSDGIAFSALDALFSQNAQALPSREHVYAQLTRVMERSICPDQHLQENTRYALIAMMMQALSWSSKRMPWQSCAYELAISNRVERELREILFGHLVAQVSEDVCSIADDHGRLEHSDVNLLQPSNNTESDSANQEGSVMNNLGTSEEDNGVQHTRDHARRRDQRRYGGIFGGDVEYGFFQH